MMFVYLFRQSTCSYLWSFNGNDQLKYAQGAAWSQDETKAYVLALSTLSQPGVQYLVVFERVFWRQPRTYTYKVAISDESLALTNGASLFSLAGVNGDDRILIVHKHDTTVVRRWSRYHRAYRQVDSETSVSALHATFDKDTNSVYLL